MWPSSWRETASKIAALNRSQAVAEFAPDGTILAANENFLNVFGYSLSEVRGRHHGMFVDEGERDAPAYKAFWDQLRRGLFQRAEFKRVGKNGREIWIQATYNPIADGDGKVYKIVKFATDVTSETLRAIDHAGQIAALHRSQAVVELALDGTIMAANENFLRAFGYSADEIIGAPHAKLVDAEQRNSVEYRRFWDTLRRGDYYAGEFSRIAKSGRTVFLQASYNPIVDRDGRLLKVVKFATDISQDVAEREHRRAVQTVVVGDLEGIAGATSDVARQSSDAARKADSVLADVQTMLAGADRLFGSADEIGTQVSKAAAISDRALEEVQQTTEAMSNLSEHAKHIGEVVSLIQSVANQTNLLALNATIEAARAGDAGRGFAIVAQEVKALAMQTTDATSVIANQIAAMQSATADMVAAIGSVRRTIAAVNEVAKTIGGSIRDQDDVRQDLAGGITAVSVAAQAITQSMKSIASATKIVDNATQNVKSASQSIR